jgi:hypothetical protein
MTVAELILRLQCCDPDAEVGFAVGDDIDLVTEVDDDGPCVTLVGLTGDELAETPCGYPGGGVG